MLFATMYGGLERDRTQEETDDEKNFNVCFGDDLSLFDCFCRTKIAELDT